MSNLDEKINTVEESVTDLESLQFFQTRPHNCSYLPDKTASTVFLNPKQKLDGALYSQLSEYGFRRSGKHIYKPLCADCQACIPMRVPVASFQPKRQQKRTWKRNQDLSISIVKSIDTDEHYALYESYIIQRHADGDMFPPSREQFKSFLADQWYSTRYYEFRDQGKLIATSVADVMDNGISAVYTYYDPSESRRSLGIFVILFLIEQAQTLSLPAVYLGYWIKLSPKMNYKAEFRPLEIQDGSTWLMVS
ncbi:MAG: arginine-tRNA-protein transferase [Cellvibrionaceae bacterium]|jgi:arginyl-tRNA--protein-N-Asp/Glu arginylyltransferase